MAILIDTEQLSKHKYVGVAYDRIDMSIPAFAVNILAYKLGWNDALDSVERFSPTVKVVRCKDCKWWHDIGCAIRILDESDEPKDDDFCSFGERREDAE